jgi:signal transduction histidine kinase
VTERKRGEIALRDAMLAAESANELKDQFLATVSHELRTPLNAILGYARLLQTDAIPPEKRQRAIDVIERNAVAQNQLVEDLLDMSRITTGNIRLDLEPVPVVTVLREALEGIKPAADAKGIAVEADVDLFAGIVRADTTRLQQVFSNLLSNAVKFTGGGGLVLAVLRRVGAHVEIAVTDTGGGISPEFLPFVFEHRGGESRTRPRCHVHDTAAVCGRTGCLRRCDQYADPSGAARNACAAAAVVEWRQNSARRGRRRHPLHVP